MTKNSVVTHNDSLHPVPNRDGEIPSSFPASVTSLAVAGNEMLADGSRNVWNKIKSIELLRFYGEEDGTDNDDEQSSSSRRRRLRVAKKVGVSPSQITEAFSHYNLI